MNEETAEIAEIAEEPPIYLGIEVTKSLGIGKHQIRNGKYVFLWLDFDGNIRAEYADDLNELQAQAEQIEAEKRVGLCRIRNQTG